MRVQRARVRLTNRHPRIKTNLLNVGRALDRVMRIMAPGNVDVVMIDDRAIARLSGRYRGSPHRTDVLAFGYGGCDPAGDIAISLDTAKRQAKERGVPLDLEVVLLSLHGLLHLSGLDDGNYADWCSMRKAEFETMMRVV